MNEYRDGRLPGSDPLTAALRALAREDDHAPAPDVIVRLSEEVRARRARRASKESAGIVGLVIAATLVAAFAGSVWLTRRLPEVRLARTPPAEITTAFMPLAFNDVPYTDAQIVRIE